MNARERLLAISLMNKARDNPLFVAEVGITGVMKKNTGAIKKPQKTTINEGGRSHERVQ